jgi:multiple sugar transport system substrate-binding protein
MKKTRIVLAGLMLIVLAVGVGVQAQQKRFDWQRFKGSSINVLILKSIASDLLEKNLPEFETLTGIKVNLQVLPEQQARQKIAIDFASGGPTVDVFDTSLHVERTRFWRAGWYEPLNTRMTSDLLSPDYQYSDFLGAALNMTKAPDGTIIGLPTALDVQVLYYRKDLFAAKGLKPPKTVEELEAVAKALHDPANNVYGYAARGLKNAYAYTFAFPLQYFKASWIDKSGKASVNTPAATKALEWYARMLRTYAPQGVVGFNWPEVIGAFAQGQLAMVNDGVGFAAQVEDPARSKVVGKVGYAVLPGNLAPTTGNAISISSRAKNKDAAFYFLQWYSSRAYDLKKIAAGLTSPRASAWEKSPTKPLETIPWARTYFDALAVGKPAFPLIAAVTELRDIVGIAIVKSIQGENAKSALEAANSELQTVLSQTEK